MKFGKAVLLTVFGILMATGPSFAGKQEARDFWTGASVLGAAGVITPEPITTCAGTGALIGQGSGFIFIGIWDVFASASTTPDAAYASLAPVVPVSFDHVACPPVCYIVNDFMDAAGDGIGQARAMNTTLQRYYGALNAGDVAAANMQYNYGMSLASDLNTTVANWAGFCSDISADAGLQSSPFASLSCTVSDVLDLRDQIVADNAFPSYEDFVFDKINPSSEEMAAAIYEMSLVDGSTITDADLVGSVIFNNGFGDALLALGNVETYLPSDFQPVSDSAIPEPTTMCLVVAGLSISALRRRGRSSSSLG
jgi:hypothetical protein